MRVYRHGFLSPDEKASNEKENNAVVLERIRQRRAFFSARFPGYRTHAALTFNVSNRSAIFVSRSSTDRPPGPLRENFFFSRRLIPPPPPVGRPATLVAAALIFSCGKRETPMQCHARTSE